MAHLTISAVGVPVADARPSNGTVVVRIGTPGEGLLSLSPHEAFALARGLIVAGMTSQELSCEALALSTDQGGGSLVLMVDGESILRVPVAVWTRMANQGTSAALALQAEHLRSGLRRPALQLGNSDLVEA